MKFVKFYPHISYALTCTELYLRKCECNERAGQILYQQKHFSFPVCNILFWRRYAGSATTIVAATSFRRVPCGYRRPRHKIYGKSPFGGSQRCALWRARVGIRRNRYVRQSLSDLSPPNEELQPPVVGRTTFAQFHPLSSFTQPALSPSVLGRPTQK